LLWIVVRNLNRERIDLEVKGSRLKRGVGRESASSRAIGAVGHPSRAVDNRDGKFDDATVVVGLDGV